MRSRGVKGNYTKRENLHLTLAFIGELDAAGIPYDRKKFSPHITLIRKPECCGTDTAQDILAALTDTKEIRMTADHVSLMRSDRGEHGMIYTELDPNLEERN